MPLINKQQNKKKNGANSNNKNTTSISSYDSKKYATSIARYSNVSNNFASGNISSGNVKGRDSLT